ncbi:hypothetical protein B0H16DRAFT_1537025 [Mycena metata]|uniref:NADAR domain-containing protein n=1 Tax=Mycena metata TaxID=1033252 RepID=A0AAD7J729_9AGAR|nr:hypothetical protein B0H16DRAFT_1537025 [Mycena metata]
MNYSGRTIQVELCENCNASPKRWNRADGNFHPYCSRSCARQAVAQTQEDCDHCHNFPKRWDNQSHTFHPYCSRTCANEALGRIKANTNPTTAPGNCDVRGFRFAGRGSRPFKYCHTYPKRWDDTTRTFHPYCSRTCANQALSRTQGNAANNARAASNSNDANDTSGNAKQPPPAASDNCIQCGVRPKYGTRPYCGKTCAQTAKRAFLQPIQPQPSVSNVCTHCGVRPKYESYPYCGKTCAQAASRPGQVQPANTASSPVSARWSIFGAGSAVGNLLWGPPDATPCQRILFYHRTDPYYSFTNFSAHPVQHLFQAFKFMDNRPDIAEKIRTVSNFPRDAFTQARMHNAEQHPNWLKMNIDKACPPFASAQREPTRTLQMDIVLWLKFTQHEDLKQELLGTGNAELVEKTPFWGTGKNNQERNELGKALERLRTRLQAAAAR